MSFIPLQSINQGVSDTTQLNALIDLMNRLATGLDSGTTVGTCSAALVLTTTLTDVPGCTVTITATGANAYAMVTGNAQFVVTGAAGITMACALFVDGVNQAALGTIRDSADNVHDGHRSFTWKIPLSAGSHTLKLQGNKSAALATCSITNTAGSNIVVQLFDLP